ncbi:coproporphyrinogen III oxidase [Trametes punicea]|nr:coproporphyrinogen III oxidase [Trametes punicea]
MATKATSKPMRERFEEWISGLQENIVAAFENMDPTAPAFKRDSWVRPQGGRGLSCIFSVPPDSSADTILEKGGVNISVLKGIMTPPAMKQTRADHPSVPDDLETAPYYASGISLVIHPRNPHAPSVHINYRYFEIMEPASRESGADTQNEPEKVLAWWFGGGADLTPSYLYEEDAKHFHGTIKAACDEHGTALYPAFKKWCDERFFIPHRGETRGIGGFVFDDLCEAPHVRLSGPDAEHRPKTAEDIFAFVRACGDSFLKSYMPILERRGRAPSTEHERRWQLIRRGRYVEFNLVCDRGTRFGLLTPGARVESVLMTMPETARWEYMCELGTDPNTLEGKLVEVLRNAQHALYQHRSCSC